MEKNNDWAVLGPSGDSVQRNFAILEGKRFQGIRPRRRFYLPEW